MERGGELGGMRGNLVWRALLNCKKSRSGRILVELNLMGEIEVRIAALEKTVRRQRWAMSVVILVAASAASSGFLRLPAPPEDLVARAIRIVNAEGQTVVSIKPNWDGNGNVTILTNGRRDGLVQIEIEAAKRVCLANRQTLANAVQAHRVKTRKSLAELVALALPKAYDALDLVVMPQCHMGGEYSVEEAGEKFGIRCSLPEHGRFVPGE